MNPNERNPECTCIDCLNDKAEQEIVKRRRLHQLRPFTLGGDKPQLTEEKISKDYPWVTVQEVQSFHDEILGLKDCTRWNGLKVLEKNAWTKYYLESTGKMISPGFAVKAEPQLTEKMNLAELQAEQMSEYRENKQMQEEILSLSAKNSELASLNETFHKHNKELQEKVIMLESKLIGRVFNAYEEAMQKAEALVQQLDHGHGSEVKCNCGFQQVCDICQSKPGPDTSATDMVNHPPHYTNHPSGVECIEITRHMTFNLGNVVKYLWRCEEKDSYLEDLKKAAWYLNDEIEMIAADRNQ